MSNPTTPIDFEKARKTAQTVLDFDRAYPGERDPVKTILATALLALLALPHDTFADLERDYIGWTARTFEDLTVEHYASKIRRETRELCPPVSFVEGPPLEEAEIPDVFLLLIGYCHAAGIDLLKVAREKLDVNEARQWDKQPDGTYQHRKDRQ